MVQFDVTTLTWKQISTLQHNRGWHAMSVVNMEDIIDQCQDESQDLASVNPKFLGNHHKDKQVNNTDHKENIKI